MLEIKTSNLKLIGLHLNGFILNNKRLLQCANFCLTNSNLALSISTEITSPAYLQRWTVKSPSPAPISKTFSVFARFASRMIFSTIILSVSMCCPSEFGPVNLIFLRKDSYEPPQLFLQLFSLLSSYQDLLDQFYLEYPGRTQISWLLSLL